MINIKNIFSGKIEKKQDNSPFLCKYKEIDNTLLNFNKNILIDKSLKLNQITTSHTNISNLCISSMFSNIKIDNNEVIYNNKDIYIDQDSLEYQKVDYYKYTSRPIGVNCIGSNLTYNEPTLIGHHYTSTPTSSSKPNSTNYNDGFTVYKATKYNKYSSKYRSKKKVRKRFNTYSSSN